MNTIKSWEEYDKSLKNFQWLKDCVPGASDVDFVLHCSLKNGPDHFLFMEFKPAGEGTPLGQKILFGALVKIPNIEVVVVHGPDSKKKYFLSGSWTGKVSKTELKNRVETWWKVRKAGK